MSLRGQRFEFDLDANDFTPRSIGSSTGLIGDIKERSTLSAPSAPTPKTTKTGFPAHKKRSTISAFKEQRLADHVKASASATISGPPNQPGQASRDLASPPSDRAIAHHVGKKYGYNPGTEEKQEISEENKQRIAQMSEEDIEEARNELMSSLNPTFVEKLLKRGKIDDGAQPQPPSTRPLDKVEASGAIATPDQDHSHQARSTTDVHTSQSDQHLIPPIHFPKPPPVDPSTFERLDPSSPSFLQDLKTHYFPSTPHDPSTLTWLSEPSDLENQESAYHPDKENYQISQLRFSFTGTLIPPTESLAIPIDEGLHHHGLAPASAGYTVPELAILSRSTLPGQRCIAYQTLGRILYRLGRGRYGDRASEMCDGLWDVVEREMVVQVMMAEANRSTGHASARAYALDALWLWQRGSGGERGLLKPDGLRAK